jgi:hypothetical protein
MGPHHTPSLLRKLVGGAMLLLVGCLSVFFAWTYSGPYRWLAELQLRWMGSYEVQLTFIFSLVLTGAPFVLVMVIWNKAARAAIGSADGGETAQPAPSQPASDVAVRQFIGRYGFALTLGAVALAFAGMSAYDFWRVAGASRMIEFSVGQLEQGGSAPGLWLALRGRKLLDEAQRIEDSYSSIKDYIPVVSGNWKAGQPVAAFIEVTNSSRDDQIRNRYIDRHEGMVDSTGLPGMVRVAFERHGLAPAGNYILVEYGRTPADARKSARDFLIIAGICALAAFAAGAWALYARKKQERPAPAEAAVPGKTYGIKSIVPLSSFLPDVPPENRAQR